MSEYYTLPNGQKVPRMGLGSTNISDTELISQIVYQSIKDGVRLIDTAYAYKSEEGIGIGIKKAIDENIVKREDLFIITKLWKLYRNNPLEYIQKSLKKLQLDYVDLYLDHWPCSYLYDENNNKINKIPLHIFWPKMEELIEKGYTKYIGCSNYNIQNLINLLSFCKIKPSFIEVEFHPYLIQNNLLYFCKKENIRMIGYNPLCKGNYDYHKDNEKIKNELLKDDIIINLSKKYNKTPGQIVLNWFLYKGVIPIPMTSKIDRMKENLGCMKFIMNKYDYEKIEKMNKNYRYGSSLTWHTIDDVDIFA